MKFRKEYRFGYEAHYHHEVRLLPENATFWAKFQLLLGKPILAYLVLSYICFVFGGNPFLNVFEFARFLLEPSALFYLFPFAFIWVAMMLIHVGKIIAADHPGPSHESTAVRILYSMGAFFLMIGLLILFLIHYKS